MTIDIICLIIWAILLVSDTIAAVFFKQKEMPALRLILAELLVVILYAFKVSCS